MNAVAFPDAFVVKILSVCPVDLTLACHNNKACEVQVISSCLSRSFTGQFVFYLVWKNTHRLTCTQNPAAGHDLSLL
jgi:hypothetical protein